MKMTKPVEIECDYWVAENDKHFKEKQRARNAVALMMSEFQCPLPVRTLVRRLLGGYGAKARVSSSVEFGGNTEITVIVGDVTLGHIIYGGTRADATVTVISNSEEQPTLLMAQTSWAYEDDGGSPRFEFRYASDGGELKLVAVKRIK